MKYPLGVPVYECYDRLATLLAAADRGSRVPDGYYVVDNSGALQESGVALPLGTVVYDPGQNLGVAASWNHILRLHHPDELVIISGVGTILGTETLELFVARQQETQAPLIYGGGTLGMYGLFIHTPELTERTGYYDEQFWPAYYEDSDYVRRMHFVGVFWDARDVPGHGGDYVPGSVHRATEARDLPTYHEVVRLSSENREYYKRKWGGNHLAETLDVPNEHARPRPVTTWEGGVIRGAPRKYVVTADGFASLPLD
jgi:hypothetical protein